MYADLKPEWKCFVRETDADLKVPISHTGRNASII
jgi:hypothetical protein